MSNKFQITNNKLQTNPNLKISNLKPYDLEERTLKFVKRVMELVKNVPKTITNSEIIKQLIRAVGSTGANYIEANESLSKKDFAIRIKICRKEAKESRYWLKLLEVKDEEEEKERAALIDESTQFIKIFSKILEKAK